MDPTRDTWDALAAMKGLKEAVVRREGIGANLPIIVTLLREGVDLLGFQLDKLRGDKRYLRNLTAAVAMTDCDAVIVATDSYMLTDQERAEALVLSGEPVDLAAMFANGDPAVSEGTVIAHLTRDGDTAFVASRYEYAGRALVWSPLDIDLTVQEVDGAVREAIDLGFGLQARRAGGPVTPADIAQRLGLLVVVPQLQAPPRNSPCGCGSGRKAKHCCWSNLTREKV